SWHHNFIRTATVEGWRAACARASSVTPVELPGERDCCHSTHCLSVDRRQGSTPRVATIPPLMARDALRIATGGGAMLAVGRRCASPGEDLPSESLRAVPTRITRSGEHHDNPRARPAVQPRARRVHRVVPPPPFSRAV